MTLLIDYFDALFEGFLNPQKRLFWGYLLVAFFLAILWLVWGRNRQSLKLAVMTVFDKNIWLSQSAKLDYQIMLINRLIMLLVSPVLVGQMALASALFFALSEYFPSRPLILLDWSAFSVSLLFTLVYFVMDDFARFLLHVMLHRIPVLWAFHKLHHSAETMTPLTVLRTHPVEMLLFSLRTAVVQSLVMVLFVFFVGDRVTLVTVLSASIFAFAFNLIGANLRHSHIPIYYPKWLEKLFISPAQHQIHHSCLPKHFDKNFGVTLAIWDRCLGSFLHSEPHHMLTFGLSSHRLPHYSSCRQRLSVAYIEPFADVFRIVKAAWAGFLSKLLSDLLTRAAAVKTWLLRVCAIAF